MILALPLPWLARRLLPPGEAPAGGALWVPFFQLLADLARAAPAGPPGRRTWGLALGIWLLLTGAALRPQWLQDPTGRPTSGRDLMLAVDLSESMLTDDFLYQGQRIDRLRAVKAVTAPFIRRRGGDRLGLILFADQAYLQTPLTFDTHTVAGMLEETVVGLVGKRTAIGDGIGLALKRMRHRPQPSRALILLTDGQNTAGEVDPLRAAQVAAQEGVRIHTIGIGAPRQGGLAGFLGLTQGTELDEATLREVARLTGGTYFRAQDPESLEGIYQELDRLEPTLADQENFLLRTELFPWLLGPAFLLLLGRVAWAVR
ncbi:MAG: VWA domain-containing protein [Magnetococcales bacterium]|nr:VWA domain-containing protein [Magnetococcales bacterium]